MNSPIAAVPPITTEAYNKLLRICRESFPSEACGVLAQEEASEHIDTVYSILNVHPDPSASFAFDPQEWTSTYFRMQKNRQRLVGFFHSHPHTAAIPSLRDHKGYVQTPDVSYWIISFANSSAPVVQPYCLEHGTFYPVHLMFA